MDLTLCQHSGAKVFEVDRRFFDDLCAYDQKLHITLNSF